MSKEFYKVFLAEDEIPKSWYNITADLKTSLDPPLDPSTKELIDPNKLKAIFPEELIKQEMATDAFVQF